ncbi:MAG: hypothetical protein K0R52_1015 [Alphaproteobacteria bacterium]|nr:hypothetical protein [Alphaproteobacteria bacterium]
MNNKAAPIIILVRPQLPENGGAVARAMRNFGLKTLRLVAPLFSPLDPKAMAMAAGADPILEEATVYATLDEAIADLPYVYGTCAAQRHMVKRYAPVREAMPEIAACWHQTQGGFKGKLHLGESIPAPAAQIQEFLVALEHTLDAKGFWRINHKKPIMWRNLQNIFTRMDLTEQEVRTLRGMIKALCS